MRKIAVIALVIALVGCSTEEKETKKDLLSHISQQIEFAVDLVNQHKDSVKVSPRTIEDGELKLVPSRDWTSGFYPGNLWMLYELTGEEKWKEYAINATIPLEKEKWNDGTHDMGFKMYCSFGKAWQHTQNTEYRDILIQSAKTLATRYNPVVGCLRSWDFAKDKWNFPVIIDNMMNLELMLWAYKETGDEQLKDIAIKHAQTTAKNHFREDNSSFHVIDYNPETSEVRKRNTHQGLSDESAWSRGQAWGLYGYTLMYRETEMTDFLQKAEEIASYILSQPGMKEGKIPYWDYDAPNIPDEPYDASAGAVIASAFFELSEYSENGEEYLNVANLMLENLSSEKFLAPVGENKGFLLEHSTGSFPHDSEIDVPLVYADYYFLECLIRKRNLEKK